MIGVFDSGVGGLTVVKEIFKSLPKYQIIYFGDTARLPYGTKGANFVKRYSGKIAKWLVGHGAKVIVIACNTSSAWAADYLRKELKGIPVFEMVLPAAMDAASITKNKRVGFIGTPGTIKSGAYKNKLGKINRSLKLFSQSCPLFVPLVEEGWIKDKVTKEIAKKYLSNLKDKNIDSLILGCTHYPLLKETIKEVVGKKVRIINPAESIVSELKDFIQKNPKINAKIKKGKNHKFFFSDEPYNFEKISHLCFNKKIDITIKDPF